MLALAPGCDVDVLHTSCRTISSNYCLEKFESGTFYLVDKRHRDAPGGAIEGTVNEIGWTSTVIAAHRRALSSGDPNGWMIIALSDDSVTGPMTDDEFHKLYPQIKTTEAHLAWASL